MIHGAVMWQTSPWWHNEVGGETPQYEKVSGTFENFHKCALIHMLKRLMLSHHGLCHQLLHVPQWQQSLQSSWKEGMSLPSLGIKAHLFKFSNLLKTSSCRVQLNMNIFDVMSSWTYVCPTTTTSYVAGNSSLEYVEWFYLWYLTSLLWK
jgi:hypothetical protein